MAPEQVRYQECDARTDLYALGVVLFEMLSGELPFDGETAVAMATARLETEPRELHVLAPDVPADVCRLVRELLARDPASRPQDASSVSERLSRRRRAETEDSKPFAPVPAETLRALAVLPLSYRGPDELADLGETLSEEIIDVLSRTRGLRVLSLGATQRFVDSRDPIEIATALGTDSIVDGSIRLLGQNLTVKARLVGSDGVQRWSERFDAPLTDALELSESMARRIAEALRLQVDARTAASTENVSREALQLYFAARARLRGQAAGAAEEAVEMLDQCLALAPGFALGMAAHAMAKVRAWWAAITRGDLHADMVEESVARALAHAPDLAETQLAQAMLHIQSARWPEAATSLGRALEIAPTFAEAQYYLGSLQVETGRLDEGLRRLELAYQLNPASNLTAALLAREYALTGDYQRAEELFGVVEQRSWSGDPVVAVGRIRVGMWRRDMDTIRANMRLLGDRGAVGNFGRFLGYATREIDRETAETLRHEIYHSTTNRRFVALMEQIAAEVYATAGDYELTLDALESIAKGAVIDVSWLRRCPLFDPLRDDPAFLAVSEELAARARAVWVARPRDRDTIL